MSRTLLLCLAASASAAPAQEDAITTHSRFVYGVLKKIVLRAAELMPEEGYGYRPTESVRSYGQVLGHVADAQYGWCSVVLGEKSPAPKVEQSKTGKAELTAALNEAFAYCDRAYDHLKDSSAAQTVKFHGRDTPKIGVLTVTQNHTIEHYGNLVTYLRMKGIVPPTSDQAFMAQAAK